MAEYVSSGGEFNRDTNYITTRITADGRDGYPVEPGRYRLIVARACPWANRAIIVRRLLGLEDVLSIGFCGPTHDERSWTFDLDPGGVDPVLKIPRLQDAYFARDPGLPEGHHGARDRRRADRAGRHQRLRADDARPVRRVDGVSPRRRTRAVSQAAARRDRRGRQAHLHRGQQRRLPVRLRRLTGGLRQGLRPVVHRAGLAQRAAGESAVPGRGHHHRSRRPVVHHAGPLRSRLSRPLQMQPVQARRDARAVGAMRATCSRPRASATPPTSSRSSSTTTSCTPTSIRRASCRRGPTCPTG